MPAPVASRRRFTSAAVNAGMSLPSEVVEWWVSLSGRAPCRGPPRARERRGQGGPSAVLGALGAGGLVTGRGHALDRGDLGRGDGRRGGRGLGQLGRRGLGGRSGVGATGEQLALPVGQRLAAADGGGLGAVLGATGVG